MANYALIKPLNSVQTVYNVIVAEPEVAETYLTPEGEYDYVIDLTEVTPTPGIGWTYDPGEDEFMAPVEDFEGELEAAIMTVHASISGALTAYLNAESGDRATAVSAVLGELSAIDEDLLNIIISVTEYLALQVE